MKTLISALALALFGINAAHALEKDVPAAVQSIRQNNPVVIDARRSDELSTGMIDGASHIPHDEMAQRIASVTTDKEQPIVVYCRSGKRAGIATDTLVEMGYRQVINGGGYEELNAALQAD